MADYETVTLERDIACSPERLFHLMTDRESRQKWIAPDDSSAVIIDTFDCRPGGREETRCGPKEAPEFNTTGLFHVVSPEFLSFTEILAIQGEVMSISLCGQEISGAADGCRLVVTLQVTSLAGPEFFSGYRDGWAAALDTLTLLASSAGNA